MDGLSIRKRKETKVYKTLHCHIFQEKGTLNKYYVKEEKDMPHQKLTKEIQFFETKHL